MYGEDMAVYPSGCIWKGRRKVFLPLADSWGRMVSLGLLDDAAILMAIQWWVRYYRIFSLGLTTLELGVCL